MPGDVLRTSVWLDGARVLFRTDVVDDELGTARPAIANACIELTAQAELELAPPPEDAAVVARARL